MFHRLSEIKYPAGSGGVEVLINPGIHGQKGKRVNV
jgi:hypothetical protein